jgi:AcrR family transcriptional regulator
MAGGTKRLPRAVREQQMLDAAVQMFSVNGYHETSMDAIAAEAEISKPMLYLYYGSKEELFGACLDRELTRFVDDVRSKIDFTQSPKDLLRNAVLAFLTYIDTNRASWMVLYTQATSSQAFAHTVREGRQAATVGHPPSRAGHRLRHDGRRFGGCRRGGSHPGQHRRCRRR